MGYEPTTTRTEDQQLTTSVRLNKTIFVEVLKNFKAATYFMKVRDKMKDYNSQILIRPFS